MPPQAMGKSAGRRAPIFPVIGHGGNQATSIDEIPDALRPMTVRLRLVVTSAVSFHADPGLYM
jgi:hypothetical protein